MTRALSRALIATIAVVLLAPSVASAERGFQYGYGGGHGGAYDHLEDEEGFFLRRGLTGGVGLGVGVLSTDSGIFDCPDCAVRPAALGLNAHIGGMLNHRTALLGEYWNQLQTLDSQGRAVGVQHMLMGSLQHWLAPQAWVKGGLGIASLQVSYDDGFVDDLNHGTALMAAAGYEVAAAPDFALDIQLRLGSGFYSYVRDRAATALIAVGASFY